MRIVSPFKDYYDSVQSYGADQSITWVRKPQETTLSSLQGYQAFLALLRNTGARPEWAGLRHSSALYISWMHRGKRGVPGTVGVIGFCGNLYPYHTISLLKPWHTGDYSRKELVRTVFSKEQAVKLIEEGEYCRHHHDIDHASNPREWDWLPHESEAPLSILPLFLDNRLVCFDWAVDRNAYKMSHLEKDTLTINPQLSPLDFQRIKDPFTAFQDLSMFLSGVLVSPETADISLTEKQKVMQKGFDEKYGFRQRQAKKRKRKS
jgi:hypothetical protein